MRTKFQNHTTHSVLNVHSNSCHLNVKDYNNQGVLLRGVNAQGQKNYLPIGVLPNDSLY